MAGIDLHTHLAPGPRGSGDPGPSGLYEPDRLEAHLDAAGLDEAVVTVPPPFYRQQLDASAAAAWAVSLNDGLLSVVAGRPRLTPLAYLPLEHPAVALAEYMRIADDPRWAGVVACAGGHSTALDASDMDPLWSVLDAGARTVQLHPGHSTDSRLAPYYLANLLGNPVETTVAAAQLVFGEVVVRYPRIRFVLLHGGGCLPAVVGRWERGLATSRPGLETVTASPTESVRNLYVDSLTHHSGVTDLAVAVFGAERIVLGSDWPFPMGSDDPAAALAHRGKAFVDQAATSNAAAALGRSSR